MHNQPRMVAFDEALGMVLASVRVMGVERVSLGEAAGRVLAGDVKADMDLPPHDVSTVDGFACRAADLGGELKVVETIAAGKMPRRALKAGECSRIMTGAPLPKGADKVVMFEHTQVEEHAGVVRMVTKQEDRNFRRQAEDVRKGTVVLRKGTVIGVPEVAALASVGQAEVQVARRPRVGVVATGDELVEPWRRPRKGQIRNSNSWQTVAQVQAMGCLATDYGILQDVPRAIDRMLKRMLRACDVMVFSGGVSAGDFDFVPGILRKNRVQLLFEKVRVKPGRPTVFGVRGRKRLFGLPGNPTAAFMMFEMLVKPLLYGMMGHEYRPRKLVCTLAETWSRENASRTEFRPVRLREDGAAELVEYHGSGHIQAYTQADGAVKMEAGVDRIEAGEQVEVFLLR